MEGEGIVHMDADVVLPPVLATGARFEPPVVETPCGDPSCEICRPA